jgi:hypothetical protein
MKGNREEVAGLWFTMAALHKNMQYYKDGELENFKEMLRRVRWSKKTILEQIFGILLNIFLTDFCIFHWLVVIHMFRVLCVWSMLAIHLGL